MEYNKGESFRCLHIAEDCLAKGDRERAIKFIVKSKKLYPLEEADVLLEKVNRLGGIDPNGNNCPCDSPQYRRRGHESLSNAKTYSEDQLGAVNRINACKDNYETLGISRDADDETIKRKYRKLALQFHPDKNQAPGAGEAFRAIGHAFSILIDPKKRHEYNLHRTNTHASANHSRSPEESDFKPDVSPDDMFDTYFDFRNLYSSRRTGSTAHTFRRHCVQQGQHLVDCVVAPESSLRAVPALVFTAYVIKFTGQLAMLLNGLRLLLQLLPLILLVMLSLCSMLFVTDNPYSLTPNQKYREKHTTTKLTVDYYVKPNFAMEYPEKSFAQLEKEVEDLYLSTLRQECDRERLKSKCGSQTRCNSQGQQDALHTDSVVEESLVLQAEQLQDDEALDFAQHLQLSYCDQLNDATLRH